MAKNKETKEQPSTLDKSIENVKSQLQEYTNQAEHFKTMKHKAEGALDVLLQLKKEEDDSKRTD